MNWNNLYSKTLAKCAIILTILSSIAFGSCLSTNSFDPANAAVAENNKDFFPLTRIVDGDTFWVDNGTGKGLKIRLIGIDAPETRNTYNKRAGYFGTEATAYMTRLVQGKRVRLVSDVDSLDRFGRTLSYAYLEDGTFVNAELLRGGFAVLLTIPPNVRFTEEFAALQREAREKKRGLWARE